MRNTVTNHAISWTRSMRNPCSKLISVWLGLIVFLLPISPLLAQAGSGPDMDMACCRNKARNKTMTCCKKSGHASAPKGSTLRGNHCGTACGCVPAGTLSAKHYEPVSSAAWAIPFQSIVGRRFKDPHAFTPRYPASLYQRPPPNV